MMSFILTTTGWRLMPMVELTLKTADNARQLSPVAAWAKMVTGSPVPTTILSSIPNGTYSIQIEPYNPISGNRHLFFGINDGTVHSIAGSFMIDGADI